MILYLDIRTAKSTIGIVGPRKADRFSSSARSGAFALLARADAKHRIFSRLPGRQAGPPTAVVVATGDRGGTASWSAVRTAVALGNTLAFAWNIPVIALPLDGSEKPGDIAAAALKAASRTRRRKWLTAAYNGEPNITKAKPVF